MTAESAEGDRAAVDGGDDLPGIAAALRRLVADGLGPAIGLRGDWRTRSAIERVARLGSELAPRLDVIYRSHRGSLIAHAARVLGNRQDAEDVVNEAFARVLRADPDLAAPEALVGYLHTVVRNVSLDRSSENNRRRAAHQPQDPVDLDVDLDARLASLDRPLEERVCDELTLAVAFHVLSPRQRQCCALRYIGDLSVKETATRLGISEGNVKAILSEVRARLAAALAAA